MFPCFQFQSSDLTPSASRYSKHSIPSQVWPRSYQWGEERRQWSSARHFRLQVLLSWHCLLYRVLCVWILVSGQEGKLKSRINFATGGTQTRDIALICDKLLCSTQLKFLYLIFQHWIANNLFGLAFAVNGIELLHLNNVMIGVILLCGLFIYDIFWVFGTNVMVTVAKSFEAPIKCKYNGAY